MASYTKYLYRHWCTKCNDWTTFEEKAEIKHCTECNTEHEKVLLSTIPEEKLQEQRERYKLQRKKDNQRILNDYLSFGYNHNPLMELLMETPSSWETRIVESDAGQKSIDEAIEQKKREEAYERHLKRQELLKWKAQYKGLGRNDMCICGSGNKYKKCCLDKVEKVK